MDTEEIRSIYETIQQYLNERDKRLLVAAMAKIEGYGGISKMSKWKGSAHRVQDTSTTLQPCREVVPPSRCRTSVYRAG